MWKITPTVLTRTALLAVLLRHDGSTGFERGFQVVFGSDLTATDDPSLQEAELSVLRKGFARVMTADEIDAPFSHGPQRDRADGPSLIEDEGEQRLHEHERV